MAKEESMYRWIGLVLLMCALDAQALTLRVCSLDQPFPPFTMPDGSGQAQELLRQASKAQGLTFENIVAPRLRCFEMMKAGEVDAMLSAYLPERRAYGAFPMAGHQVNESMQLGAVRFLVYRKQGDHVQWNGRKFIGLGAERVGVLAGLAVAQLIRQSGAATDEGAKTIEQNFEKLAIGRIRAVVALEGDAQRLLELKFKDRLEALPIAFDTTPIYLHVNLDYYAHNKARVEQFWKAIKKTRESPSYQQFLKRYKS
jgi:polar amino acid transport system substrate-binding protein